MCAPSLALFSSGDGTQNIMNARKATAALPHPLPRHITFKGTASLASHSTQVLLGKTDLRKEIECFAKLWSANYTEFQVLVS